MNNKKWNQRKKTMLLLGVAVLLLLLVIAAGFWYSERALTSDFSQANLPDVYKRQM